MWPFEHLETTDANVNTVIRITGAVVAFLLLSKLMEPIIGQSTSVDMARELLGQSTRFYAASVQDGEAVFALQHISHARAYLNAARQLVSDAALERSSGIDIHVFQAAIEKQHKAVLAKLAKTCPKLNVTSSFASANGWLN